MERKRKYFFDIMKLKEFFSFHFRSLLVLITTYTFTLLISKEYFYLPLADISLVTETSYHHDGILLALELAR